MPAQAGIQSKAWLHAAIWIPAFAGMTLLKQRHNQVVIWGMAG